MAQDVRGPTLFRTEVRAPVAGRVVARNALVGAIAAAGVRPMFTLARDGAVEMCADVSERDVLRLAAGQSVTLTSIGLAAPQTGAVRLVEPSIGSDTRRGGARMVIDDPSPVVDGRVLTAEIMVAETDILAVPATAVSADGPSALRVREGLVERVPVTAGVRDGDRIGVTAGLASGDSSSSRPRPSCARATPPIRTRAEEVVAQPQGP